MPMILYCIQTPAHELLTFSARGQPAYSLIHEVFPQKIVQRLLSVFTGWPGTSALMDEGG